MKLRNSVNGNVPFEGDRTFRWQAIPANAKILSATATVTPVDSGLDGSFVEVLGFSPASINFGATRSVGGLRIPGPPVVDLAWVEVDFHTRRTIAGVNGNFHGATLQVDVGGGTYVEINQAGAFKTPSDATDFSLTGASLSVPSLTVAKLKLTQIVGSPDLATVIIHSAPSNVSLRVGALPAFWTRVGEMIKAETTPDFAAVLQAALTTAKVENGFYDLPLTIHSDSIARLKIELEIEVLAQQNVLSKAVPEIALPFDVSTLSNSKAAELSIEVPVNSRVVAGQTTLRVRGSFSETRIAYGPTGADKPVAAVEVSPAYSQAQIIALETVFPFRAVRDEVAAVAVDLLLEALTPSVRLQLDIRGDFDGKPDETPLLPTPVEFRIEQQADKGATWTSVQLPSEFLFAKAGGKNSRYWLLLQSLEGRAAWSVQEVPKVPAPKPAAGDIRPIAATANPDVNVQRTRDGGLSWQETTPQTGTLLDKQATPPFIAFARLRDKPKTFKMPIQLQVGSGGNEVRKALDRFDQLGRVDFTIDAELADGINEYLAKASAAAVPATQHLVNADFERWDRVGEQMIARRPIDAKVPINAVAFAPDGTLAYVLDQDARKDGFLLVVDVACNKIREKIALGLRDPIAFVVHPDGTRAYVTDGRNLQSVNLDANEALGTPSLILGDGESPVRNLALSPDGRRLYWVGLNITARKNAVRIIDTANLELGVSFLRSEPKVPANLAQIDSPVAVALSPDESLLYMLVDRGAANPAVEFIDTANFTAATPPAVGVGQGATALALTQDGKRAVVTNMDDDNVSIIDTTTRTAVSVAVQQSTGVLKQLPKVVALSANGKHAYVFNRGSRSINVIDINSRTVIESFTLNDGTPVGENVEAIALSPQGGQMYVTNSRSQTISSIQFGVRVPSEWQRTSGEVVPLCLPSPFHQVAALRSEALPSSISQVVPVAESVVYEFSFWGIAVEPRTDEPPATAEVLWLNSACGLIKTDSLPIEVIDIQGDGTLLEALNGLAGSARGQKTPLVFHRAQFSSPAGANQAEVRFSVGKTAGAMIDLVSLAATSEVAANGDFQQQKNGQLVGWTLAPDAAPGFMVSAAEKGLQLRNAGGASAELVQLVPAESDRPFTVEFQGKATADPSSQLPRIELRWLKDDGSRAGDPTVLEIQPAGLDAAIASGTVPKESSKVEIHLVTPAKTTMEVERVSLQYPRSTAVPVKFISEAPGDLTVSEVRIAFEKVAPKAPAVPGRLCTATPPGREPGEKGDSCFCHECEEETGMTDIQAVVTQEGRPAMMARCAACGTDVLSVGGPVVADAKPLPLRQTMVPSPVFVRAPVVTPASTPPQAVAEATLTDIHGIGEKRAKQLTEIGIDSVEKLAASTPESVAEIKFITPEVASQIIAQAKSRLTGS